MNARSLSGRAPVLLPFVLALVACSPARDARPRVATAAAGACASLASAQVAGVSIREAVPLEAADRPTLSPAGAQRLKVPHCKVAGTIDGSIGFELLLPNDWNGKFVMGGGGGFVGSVQNQAQDGLSAGPTPLERGYATVGTDTGHVAAGTDASWARNDAQARENFAHRAVHRTAEVSKAIVADYYKHAVDRSYFFGCSRGGGQAMVEAERYPDDFDGIIAGAPVLDWVGAMGAFVRDQQAIFPDPTHLQSPVITADNRKLLATALKNTLRRAGRRGRRHHRRSAELQVRSGVVAALHGRGLRPSASRTRSSRRSRPCTRGLEIGGERVYPGFPFGGENVPGGWDLWITQTNPPALGPDVPNLHYAFGTEFVKNFVFGDPELELRRLRFRRLARAHRGRRHAAECDRPRSRQVRAARGPPDSLARVVGPGSAGHALDRLLHFGGDAEPARAPVGADVPVARRRHCAGGLGPDRADWLTTLEQWVEKGAAPDQVLMTKNDAQGKVVMERPVCAYPLAARYNGSGDANRAASYTCVGPQ